MTTSDQAKLIAEVRETRVLAEAAVQALFGKEARQRLVQQMKVHLASEDPLDSQVPVWSVGLNNSVVPLIEADIRTLGDLAQYPRSEIAAMPGIGRVSMKKLDAAMAERGLSWAVTV